MQGTAGLLMQRWNWPLTVAGVIRECETYAIIKKAEHVKPLWYGRWWLRYHYGEPGRSITSYYHKHQVFTMREVTSRCLETSPVTHTITWNTILGLENEVLCQHGTSERTESKNGAHFWNSFRHLGQGIWHWLCVSHPLSGISLSEDWKTQWAVRDYTESNGCWDRQELGWKLSRSQVAG